MSRKRHKPEEIVAKLRQVDVLMAQGMPVADAVRSIGVTEVASGRAAGWGDRLLSAGNADHHRELETSLQCRAPARLSGLPSTGSGGFVPAFAAWPTAPPRPAPPATLPVVQRPTLK
jgi:hypothetical protein